jgi:hypothetical protein
MPRIFKQLGHGYGADPVSIVAQIDGNTVFSGTIPTTDVPVPGVEPGVQLGLECFQWTEATGNFVGTQSLSITVTGGTFQIGQTLAQSSLANADQYGAVYQTDIGNVIFSDPLTNVSIGGEPRVRPDDPELTGQWGWTLESGQTLSATLNINTSQV